MSDKREELKETVRILDDALNIAIKDFAYIEQMATDPAVARAARLFINNIVSGDKETNEIVRFIKADRWDLI